MLPRIGYVSRVVYNFSILRLFCAGSGLTVLLYVGKNILPVLDHVGVEENIRLLSAGVISYWLCEQGGV